MAINYDTICIALRAEIFKSSVRKKLLFYSIIFLCVPLGIFITVIVRWEPNYGGKNALGWFKNMKIESQSQNLEALKKMGKPAVPMLEMELKSQEIGYRIKAAWALGKLGPVAFGAVPDLIKSLDDQDMIVRFEAINALSELNASGKDLTQKLIARLGDDNVAVNNSAAALLNKMEEQHKSIDVSFTTNEYEYTVAFLNSPSLRVKLIGVNRIMKLPQDDENVRATIKMLLKDTNPAIREQALVLLKQSNGGGIANSLGNFTNNLPILPKK